MYHSRSPVAPSRRGVILLVVVSLLTLFAIVGLSFVMYAESEAKGAQTYRVASVQAISEAEPELLLNYFLDQLIYDVRDNEPGVYSAFRGHGLLRNMFGLNYEFNDTAAQIVAKNNVPFNGTGRLHTGRNTPLDNPPQPVDPQAFYNNPFNLDDYYLINYTYFRDDPQLPPAQRFLRDPERLGPANTPGVPSYRTTLTQARGPFTGGFNAPYTYPDLNNMFLAAVRADGTVLLPSFHRPWLFGPNDPSNPNWTNDFGKYLTLRPRPLDHTPAFPYPEDATGDVKNLVGAPGGNDSYWIDLGFPVKVTPEGKKYKPLFAPLILDLDSRLNLSVHGNAHGTDPLSIPQSRVAVSNQGWGRWEVNLERLVSPFDPQAVAKQQEWVNLFAGNSTPPERGRYGGNGQPLNGATDALAGKVPHFYTGIDYDARRPNQFRSGQFLMPGAAGHPSTGVGFPVFPAANGYGNYGGELRNHPLLYNPFVRGTGPNDDLDFFKPSNYEALARYSDTNSPALTSSWYRLLPRNSQDGRLRRLVTTHSYDVDRPGLTPWVWNPEPTSPLERGQRYTLRSNAPAPSGSAIPFPSLALRHADPNPIPYLSEFRTRGADPQNPPIPWNDARVDWRAAVPAAGRVDLNRTLPDYPELHREYPDGRIGSGRILFADQPQFYAAQDARVQLAREIFERLKLATGAVPQLPNMNTPEFQALRWLAQLAVNIVDYIDPDDYSTPFKWHETPRGGGIPPELHWVYGTELPRVVLNEAFASYDDSFADKWRTQVWVELHNPLMADATLHDNGAARLFMPRVSGAGNDNGPSYSTYRLFVCKPTVDDHLRLPQNVTGSPKPIPGANNDYVFKTSLGGMQDALVDKDEFSDGRTTDNPEVPYLENPALAAIDRRFLLPFRQDGPGPDQNRGNRIFSVIGKRQLPGAGNLTLLTNLVEYEEARTAATPSAPTLVLQRLACPHLRPNDYDPNTNQLDNDRWPYNPYLTVDYMERVRPYLESALANAASEGRPQPYAAFRGLKAAQTTPSAGPRNTFFRRNVPGPEHYDWLVHLDRPLISPMELLHVSAFKPHELTQQFMLGTDLDKKFQHTALWTDSGLPAGQSSRLYRVLEYLETHDRGGGMRMTANVTGVQHVYPSPNPGPGQGVMRHIVPNRMEGVTNSGAAWRIVPGAVLVLDRGDPNREETVVVDSLADATSFRAFCYKPHGPPGAASTIWMDTMGDRVPGKININTVWDGEILAALADAQPANRFYTARTDLSKPHNPNDLIYKYVPDSFDPTTIFGQMVRQRTPGMTTLGANDRPYLPLSTGTTLPNTDLQNRNGIGVEDTFFRAFGSPDGRRLFQPPLPDPNAYDPNQPASEYHPYVQAELLTKIYNNLTTRSNVFAVWLTVGFFEVVDDSTRPVKLGAEIGRAENRHIRHRMFSVIDRSHQVTSEATTVQSVNTTTNTDVAANSRAEIAPLRMNNIHPGTRLTIAWTGTDPTTGLPRNYSFTDNVLGVDLSRNPPVFYFNLPADLVAQTTTITGNRNAVRNAQNLPLPNPGPNTAAFPLRQRAGLVPYYSIIH